MFASYADPSVGQARGCWSPATTRPPYGVKLSGTRSSLHARWPGTHTAGASFSLAQSVAYGHSRVRGGRPDPAVRDAPQWLFVSSARRGGDGSPGPYPQPPFLEKGQAGARHLRRSAERRSGPVCGVTLASPLVAVACQSQPGPLWKGGVPCTLLGDPRLQREQTWHSAPSARGPHSWVARRLCVIPVAM